MNPNIPIRDQESGELEFEVVEVGEELEFEVVEGDVVSGHMSRVVDLLIDSERNEELCAAELAVLDKVESLLNGKAPGAMIGGKFEVGQSERELVSVDPSTGLEVYRGREASVEQVGVALDKANEAFEEWSELEWAERAEYLNRLAEVFEQKKLELAVALSVDTGRLLSETKIEAASLIAKIKAAVDHEYANPKVIDEKNYVLYKPLGTVAVIGPFNIPAGLLNGPAVHALAMGNTVVVKFSDLTPLVGHIYAECLAEAGFPEGVFSCVQGGRAVGEALVDPTKIKGLFFTGSSEAGIAINQKLSSNTGVLASLEMSGVNPMVLDLDCSEEDLDGYVDMIIKSSFFTTGQRCVNGRHLYCIGGDVAYGRFESKLAAKLVGMTTGPWNQPEEPDFGPLISAAAAKKVYDAAKLVAESGTVIAGDLEKEPNGAFMNPVVIAVDSDYPAGQEIFGPVLLVSRASNAKKAFKLANRTQKVISVGVYSKNLAFAKAAIKKLNAGLIRVNEPTTGASGLMPFGGVGEAGNHRPVGSETMDQCCIPVAVTENNQLFGPQKS